MEEPDKKEDAQDAAGNVEDSSVQTDGKHVWYQGCSLHAVRLQYVVEVLSLLCKRLTS